MNLAQILKFLREPDSEDIHKRYLRAIILDVIRLNNLGITETVPDLLETEFFPWVRFQLQDMGFNVDFSLEKDNVRYQVKWD